jgi:tetratricopeptide (TPR) repeat protein
MRMSTRLAVMAGALVLARQGASVAQEPPSAVGEVPTDEELLAKGVALRRIGRDAEALAAFERANALRPSARAAAQIALAHQALAQWREAERGLVEALGNLDDSWVARNREHLEHSLAAVGAHLAWLEVESNVAGAQVWIGGELFGGLPLDRPTRIAAGEVTVELRAPGYAPIQHTFQVEAKSQAHASFTFVTQSAAQPHLSADDSRVAPPAALRPTSARRTAGWFSLAGAGGLLLAGIAGAVTREWEARIYNDDSKCAPAGNRSRYELCGTNQDIGSAAQTIAIVAFVGSGVAGVASGVLLLGTSRSAPAPTMGRIDCTLAGLGLSCLGAF